jgi:hypothetical protein
LKFIRTKKTKEEDGVYESKPSEQYVLLESIMERSLVIEESTDFAENEIGKKMVRLQPK